MSEPSRDRPYYRIVVVDTKDELRLETILKDIPRTDVIKSCTTAGSKTGYLVRVKKIELLTIKLSIAGVTVDKPSRARKSNNYFESECFVKTVLRHRG